MMIRRYSKGKGPIQMPGKVIPTMLFKSKSQPEENPNGQGVPMNPGLKNKEPADGRENIPQNEFDRVTVDGCDDDEVVVSILLAKRSEGRGIFLSAVQKYWKQVYL